MANTESSLSAWEQNEKTQREIISDFAARIVQGENIDPKEIEIFVSATHGNNVLRDFAIKNKIATLQQFRNMERRKKIENALGTVPQSATDFVKIVVKRDKIECQYDGMLTRDVVPFMMDEKTGEKLFFDAESLKDPSIRMHCDFLFPKRLNFLEFERDLRIINSELRLGFTREDIADAVTKWHETSKNVRLLELFGRVGAGKPMTKDVEAAEVQWQRLADTIFNNDETGSAFTIAVLKKFIWQVKRKIRGLPVTNHLMPVILGPQGKGKTTLVNKLMAPLRELTLEVDFKMVEDDRNIDIWNSYILFLDEMGYASKANVDSIKHAITATHLARRPMRTNSKVMVDQNATFIGCSNKTLAQLIKDPTGIRRFVGLQFLNNPCRETMNSIDYDLLWLSVDVNGEDPMAPFMGLLGDKQEEDREKGRVEHWLSEFDPNAQAVKEFGKTFLSVSKRGQIAAKDLFELYSEWESVMYPGSYGRLNLNEWGHEMKRLADNAPGEVPFDKKRVSTGITYIYTGPMNVIPMTKGRKVGYAR